MSDDELGVVKFLVGERAYERGRIDGHWEDQRFVVLKPGFTFGTPVPECSRMLDVWFGGGKMWLEFYGFCDNFEVVDSFGLLTSGASSRGFSGTSNRGFKPDGRGGVFVECVVRVCVDLFDFGDFVGLRDVVLGGLEASVGCVFPDVRWLAVLRDRLKGVCDDVR